jgi:hypothetical protein
MGTKRLLALICLLCAPALASAQVYKYVDDKGRTIYTDSPPKNAKKITSPDLIDTHVSPGDKAKAEAQAQRDIDAARESSPPASSAVTTGPSGERERQCREAEADLEYWSKAAFNARSPATYEREMRDKAIWTKRKYCN